MKLIKNISSLMLCKKNINNDCTHTRNLYTLILTIIAIISYTCLSNQNLNQTITLTQKQVDKFYSQPQSEPTIIGEGEQAVVKVTMSTADNIAGVNSREFAWSLNATQPPTEWKNFLEGQQTVFTTANAGSYYLWTRVIDRVGNIYQKASNPYIIADSGITITPNTTEITDNFVLLRLTYGLGLTQNRRYKVSSDGDWLPVVGTEVKITENDVIYFSAQDTMGNTVVASVNVVNIKDMNPGLKGFDKSTTYYVRYNESTGAEMLTPMTEPPPTDWYSYEAKKWANIKTTANGVNAYWVWIPRYEYKIPPAAVGVADANALIDVKFIPKQITIPTAGYQIPEAFWWDQNGDGVQQVSEAINGYWMAKYEASVIKSEIPNSPNLEGFDKDTTYYVDFDSSGNEIANTKISSPPPANWYNYNNKKWANLKTTANGVNAYWVWIPRYEYNIPASAIGVANANAQIDVTFITKDKTIPTIGYQIPEAFWWDQNDDGAQQPEEALDGYWMAKYEASVIKSEAPNPPNLEGFDKNTTYYVDFDSNGNEISSTKISSPPPANWYNYNNKKWANLKTTANGINAYWVWIPRYEYNIPASAVGVANANALIDVTFITKDKTIPTIGYQIPEAFWWDQNDDGAQQPVEALDGYWMAKYEASVTP